MKTPKVSIIVTSYNQADLLPVCLDALLAQTLEDIEIICVDDASTDNTVAVLNKYKEKDERVIVIANEENRGPSPSVVRNQGIDIAKADFIMFCDGDDYYDETMCEKMYNAITKHKADLAICEIGVTYEAHPEMKVSDDNYYALKYHDLQAINRKVVMSTDFSPVNKIFRKDILNKYNIRFPEGLFYEDAYFVAAYFCASTIAYYVNEQLYHYIRHKNSIMSQTWSSDNTIDKGIDHLYIAFRLFNFLESNQLINNRNDFYWDFFCAYERLAIQNSKSKARIKQVKQEATDFIAKHNDLLQSDDVNVNTRNGIKYLSSTHPYLDSTKVKHFLLRFMPAYRQEVQNIHDLRALRFKHQRLLNELEGIIRSKQDKSDEK